MLYVSPDTSSQKVDRVQIGREMVVAEKSGPWMRVYANTDIEEEHIRATSPMFGSNDTPPPISGWMEAKGVVEETTPNGDQVLMGSAANQEALASRSARPGQCRQKRAFALSPVGRRCFPTRRWRPKPRGARRTSCGRFRRPTSLRSPQHKDRDPDMREQMDEDDLKKGHQVLSAHALGRFGGLRSDRQQALRRLAGHDQVP